MYVEKAVIVDKKTGEIIRDEIGDKINSLRNQEIKKGFLQTSVKKSYGDIDFLNKMKNDPLGKDIDAIYSAPTMSKEDQNKLQLGESFADVKGEFRNFIDSEIPLESLTKEQLEEKKRNFRKFLNQTSVEDLRKETPEKNIEESLRERKEYTESIEKFYNQKKINGELPKVDFSKPLSEKSDDIYYNNGSIFDGCDIDY